MVGKVSRETAKQLNILDGCPFEWCKEICIQRKIPILTSLDDENYSLELIKKGAILIDEEHALFLLPRDNEYCDRLTTIYTQFSVEC